MFRHAILIALAVLLAAAAGYATGSGTADDSCGVTEVEVDGDCEAVRRGAPADPPPQSCMPDDPRSRAEHVAHFLIDEDPSAGALSGRCAFQGVAARRVDVFLCVMRYVGAPVTIRIEHDRGTLIYRWTFLADPQPAAPIYEQKPGSHGTCIYEGGPPCQD